MVTRDHSNKVKKFDKTGKTVGLYFVNDNQD